MKKYTLSIPARLRVAGWRRLHEGRVARGESSDAGLRTLAGVASFSYFCGKPAAQHAFIFFKWLPLDRTFFESRSELQGTAAALQRLYVNIVKHFLAELDFLVIEIQFFPCMRNQSAIPCLQ